MDFSLGFKPGIRYDNAGLIIRCGGQRPPFWWLKATIRGPNVIKKTSGGARGKGP